MSSYGEISTTVKNNVATIEFYHPKGNSLPGEILDELANSIASAGHNERVKVVVLKSRGEGAFCGGALFDELSTIENREEGKNFFMGFAEVINAIRKCRKLIIGRIHGKAVGGGVGLAAACDYALAAEEAHIKLSELALGIGPFVVGPAVERKIDTAAFGTLALNPGRWSSAEWAYQQGLYTELHPDTGKLDTAVEKLAGELASYSAEAMHEIKKMLWHHTDHWDSLLEKRAEISGRLVLSDYTRNFIARFKKNRH